MSAGYLCSTTKHVGHSKNNILTFKDLFFRMTVGVGAASEHAVQSKSSYYVVRLFLVQRWRFVRRIGEKSFCGAHWISKENEIFFFLCLYKIVVLTINAKRYSIAKATCLMMPKLCQLLSNCWNILFLKWLTDWAKEPILRLAFKHPPNSHKTQLYLLLTYICVMKSSFRQNISFVTRHRLGPSETPVAFSSSCFTK